ncbi:viroplasmin family protein [Natranaerobius trueperi]|uniref:Ribonuclease H n=1 Tax=Natranaerobius trueperi TaxID=759412 RepID=A0A226BWR8_9FIRM|nr:ribonuclease H family protein [Natranaerobius trueperi]OWZ83405.1 hypothetical protein CDO51_08890 [Natranaerobius trueperi]
MARKKSYYAVRQGRKTGIYYSWDECKKQIDGYSNAEYKKFSSLDEAKAYLGEESKKQSNLKTSNSVLAYIDGSYCKKSKLYSYGCVILKNNTVITEFNGTGKDTDLAKMRNVAGELLGAIKAIEWAYEHNYEGITLYYDYEGIEKWAKGFWKTNKEGTKDYAKFIQKYLPLINIDFKKVAAHSGDYYNDKADELAKQAITNYLGDNNSKKQDKISIIFDKVMTETESNKKTSINFNINGYSLTEQKVSKFTKEVWKSYGNKIKDIDEIKVNINTKTIHWVIKDQKGSNHEFSYSFD